MEYIFVSFLAGILTVLAPCVFTLLPVILGGTLTGSHWRKPVIIITSLSISIFVFTLLLRASTVLISIDQDFWKYLSGLILVLYGIFLLFPRTWSMISSKLNLSAKSEQLLQNGEAKSSLWGEVLVGVSLGPVFSSCSPTYALIIATILPQTPAIGLLNLLFYIAGLALILALIAMYSQAIISRLKWAVKPNGFFKRFLGILFVVVGLFIMLGLDKQFETFLLDRGLFDTSVIERSLVERLTK